MCCRPVYHVNHVADTPRASRFAAGEGRFVPRKMLATALPARHLPFLAAHVSVATIARWPAVIHRWPESRLPTAAGRP
jgi:hypothetical protein